MDQAVLLWAVRHWMLTTLREKLIKIEAKVVRHSRKIEDRFPDDGGGGLARVVPGHSGRDWAAEIVRSGIRIWDRPVGFLNVYDQQVI